MSSHSISGFNYYIKRYPKLQHSTLRFHEVSLQILLLFYTSCKTFGIFPRFSEKKHPKLPHFLQVEHFVPACSKFHITKRFSTCILRKKSRQIPHFCVHQRNISAFLPSEFRPSGGEKTAASAVSAKAAAVFSERSRSSPVRVRFPIDRRRKTIVILLFLP